MNTSPELFFEHLSKLVEAVGQATAYNMDNGRSRHIKAAATARKHARTLFLMAGWPIDPDAQAQFDAIFGAPRRNPRG